MYRTTTRTAAQPANFKAASALDTKVARSGNGILDRLDPTDLRTLLSRSERVELRSGDTIARPGEDVPFVDFPVGAVVSHFQILKDGKTAEIAMTGREGALGIQAAFRPGVSKEFSEVLVGGEAIRIDAAFLRNAADRMSGCRSAFFDYFNENLDRISRRVICNNYHSVEERLCLWLMLVRDRCGIDSLPFTQEQVSFFLGVHRPSVTLAMQELRKAGVVAYSRGTVHVKEPAAMIERACSCYSSLSVKDLASPGTDGRTNGNGRMPVKVA
ncbi:MAG: Crp/Fnr family transcriptional regulator [Aridibacter famidurans]|nr:Crp/Fnr family transcriptional regulator [Aridibacter famidurans]